MCISFHCKGFSWLNKMTRIQVSYGILWKYLCILCLCLCIKDNHRKNLQVSNCAKDCQYWTKQSHEKSKTTLFNFLKPMVKAWSIATPLLTKLGRCPGSAQRQYCKTDTTLRGASFFTPIFCLISIDSGLDITGEKICLMWWL